MSSIKRPPARFVPRPPIEPLPRFEFHNDTRGRFVNSPMAGPKTVEIEDRPRGVINSFKRYRGASRGVSDPLHSYEWNWLDTTQVNPAHEQPKLIFYSGAQPIIRWGHRRWVRTFMAAGPRFLGRWFYAGFVQNQFVVRPRITGIPIRRGTAYTYPRSQVGPRAIPLGGA